MKFLMNTFQSLILHKIKSKDKIYLWVYNVAPRNWNSSTVLCQNVLNISYGYNIILYAKILIIYIFQKINSMLESLKNEVEFFTNSNEINENKLQVESIKQLYSKVS